MIAKCEVFLEMEIKEEHKALLVSMGLNEGDFDVFDGKHVSYEYDDQRGIRLYDPLYRTSYDEYIDVDGWSSWSSEGDTFMSDILKGAKEEAERREKLSVKPAQDEVDQTLQNKFGEAGKNSDS
ncbi:hypothetical protein ACFL9T_17180, partial [Thermodesulfobacteriota bacterium]